MACRSMSSPTVSHKLYPPHLKAYQQIAPGHRVSLAWGRGVGKSHFIRFVACLLVAQWRGRYRDAEGKQLRGVRIVVLMPTLKHFRDVHWTLLKSELRDEWAFLGAKPDGTTMLISFPDGSWIQPFPATEHNSKSSRGIRCDVVLMDECDDIDRHVYESVARPWFSEPWSLKIMLAGGTPRRGRHGLLYHLHKLGLSAEAADARYFTTHATYRDVPALVSPDEAEDARAHALPGVFAREWECDFDSGEGLVYPFDEGFHVRACPDNFPFVERLVGADFGWSDPGVLLEIGIIGHGDDAIAWVVNELYETERRNDWWNDRAREWHRRGCSQVFCDPSRPDRIADLNNYGIPATAADNSIEAGVGRVANMLVKRAGEDGAERARLYVHPRCVNTIREFGLYRRKRDPRNGEQFLETIEDRNNHAMDALRYALVMRFGRYEYGKHVGDGR